MPPPTTKLGSQNGNSCAAHCTAIAVAELTNTSITQKFAEDTLWPAIQFKVEPSNSPIHQLTQHLNSKKNADPRLVISEIKRLWSGRKAELICDENQKNATLLAYVPISDHVGMNALFSVISPGLKQTMSLSPGVFYSCSYTMHEKKGNVAGGIPSTLNYTGLHNILVITDGTQVYYYNPNESQPDWGATQDWKKLENQNQSTSACSYVFSGVAVAIS